MANWVKCVEKIQIDCETDCIDTTFKHVTLLTIKFHLVASSFLFCDMFDLMSGGPHFISCKNVFRAFLIVISYITVRQKSVQRGRFLLTQSHVNLPLILQYSSPVDVTLIVLLPIYIQPSKPPR